jgi:hypothetical protein
MSTTDPGHGLSRPDDSGPSGAPDAATIARGHEVDRYDATSVISVPLLVVLFFVLAFGTVSVIFYFIFPSTDEGTHPQAVDRNKAPLGQRLDRIRRGGEIDQPRLEPLRIRTGDVRAITSPEAAVGNSPELHPEDLRPTATNTPALFRAGWVGSGKEFARISIDEAMNLAVEKHLLPAAKTPSGQTASWNLPSAANAGRGDQQPGKSDETHAPHEGKK